MALKGKKVIQKRESFWRWLRWGMLVILVIPLLSLSMSALPTLAQTDLKLPSPDLQQKQPIQPEPATPASPSAPGLNDPQEFAAFIDQFFKEEMPKEHIPGAAVSVVKDGGIFFTKGYGYANVEEQIPVVADRTLFRVASLSKLFTATAAMQLYEQGLLDLNADVNQYLPDFRLENPYSEPVTAAQLMMHTDGTTKRRIGIAARTAAEMEPLGDYLANHMPPVVWKPGELYSYSSHSIALLGYLVERLSNTPFAEYIDRNVFQPLQMRRSTFLQPPPPELAKDLAVGYQYQSGKFKPVPFLYLNIAPGAAMSATATDMANFMTAQLQNGRDNNTDILKPETVQLMHEQHFTHHPKLPGTGYSFRERLENNIRMVGHLGSLRGYSSSLTLMPDRNIGIFIGSNSFGGIHEKLLNRILDRYFPVANEAPPIESALSSAQLDRFTGTYRDLEYPRDTFAILSAPFERIHIKQSSDRKKLLVSTPGLFFMGNAPKIQLVPMEQLLFRRANDDAFAAFGEDAEERITYGFNLLWPKIGAYHRVSWYETIWVQFGLIAFCAVIFLSAAIVWPIAPLIRRLQGEPFQVERRFSEAWLLSGLIGTLNLVFLIGFSLSLWLIGVWKIVDFIGNKEKKLNRRDIFPPRYCC
ncbi:beta-lactamase family protein [Leptolyngbya sp. GB1-A1]|uniref:serine hydrolase domain-containing protein n=1 Tax=Leptolyngbya sp. GB1-A1 TaxID=2933908 RepID=UPI0032970026